MDMHAAPPRNKPIYNPKYEEMGLASQTDGSSVSSLEEDRFNPSNDNRGNQSNDKETRLTLNIVQKSLQTMVTIMERQFDQQKEHEEHIKQLLTIVEGAKIDSSAVLEEIRRGRKQTRNLIAEISQRSSQDYNQLAEMILGNKNELADSLLGLQKQIQHPEPRRETNLHPHNAAIKE